MKITCTREGLLAACQIVGSAVAARTTRPILANIKAVAEEDALVLMGTDADIGIRYELRGVTVHRAGAAILPPQRLTGILRETGDGEITIDAGPEGIKIRLSTGRYELPAGNPDEFPDIPGFDAGPSRDVTAGALRALIKRTAFAAEKKESTRWAVTGVLWEFDGPQLRLVATDTKRLAMAAAEVPAAGDDAAAKMSALVPLKAVSLLERNLMDDGEMVRVALRPPNEAMFGTESGRVLIHTKLVEGRFPPYRDIVPKKMAVRIEVSGSSLLQRVRQAAITTDEESKRVDFRFEPGKATLSARGPETGSSEVEMELPDYTGQTINIAFDPAYLTEMLRAVESEPTLQLEMTDGQKPAVFRIGDGYLYLVMPLAG